MGPTTFGIGGGMQNMQGGSGLGEASHAGSAGGQGTMLGAYSRSGHHGPNSTADSSVHKLAMTPGSVYSMAPRESRDSGTIKGGIPSQKSLAAKNHPAILDKDKLKLILDNLRNDKPTGVKSQARPRYLNTIESEGNLPV